ncbi:hypothetical protein E3Q18_01415 [Wallemia mellicola]|nr:hypothetical protein E3Q18_01415 [Wallemia mellicola]
MSSLQDQIAQLASYDADKINKPSKRDSYLFQPDQAADLDVGDVHLLAIGGFDQLKELDKSFEDFDTPLFGEPTKDLDRTSLNQSEVDHLNTTLNRFLVKLSPHLPTRAAAKVLEWLIRKFRVHEFNIDATLIAFLPYHDSSSFAKILQLLKIPAAANNNKYSFLLPVKKSQQSLQRTILIRAIRSDLEVLKLVCQSLPSALEVVSTHRPLSSFWTVTLLEYIQQSRQIADGELTTLYSSIRATLRNKTSKDAQYAARMVFVVLAQKMALGDKLLASLMVAMLKTVDDGKTTDSEADQVLLTVFAIIDAQGVQVAQEDYAKRILSISDLGNRLLGYLDNYSVDKGIASLIPAFMVKAKDNESARSTLTTLLESPKLSKIVGQAICDALVHHAASEEYSSLISLAYQRWGETFDNSIQKYQISLDDNQRKELFAALTSANSGGMHATVNTGDNATTLFLSTNAADNTTRALAVSHLLDQIKSKQIDDMKFVQDTLVARLMDDVPSIVLSVYSHPSIVLDNVPAETILETIDQSLKSQYVQTDVILAHVGFLAKHFARRHKDTSILPVIWKHLLVTSKNLPISEKVWRLIKESNIKEGALKGTADAVVKRLDEKDHKNVNHVIAQSLSKNLLKDHDILVDFISKGQAHNTRALGLLVASHVLQQVSRESKLKLAAKILDNATIATLENPLVNDTPVITSENVSSMLFKKPNSDTTEHFVVALAVSTGIADIALPEISWLSRSSRDANKAETEFSYAVYKLGNAPYVLTNLATILLRSLFVALRETSLSFLASIYTNRQYSDHIRNAAIKHTDAFLKVSATAEAKVDFQTILPSVLIALQDPIKDVRLGAIHCLRTLSKSNCTTGEIYAFDKIYGSNSKHIQYLGSDEVQEYCKSIYDENDSFVTDETYLKTFHSSLLGKNKSEKKISKKLKVSVICYLFSHVVGWQDIDARCVLLDSLVDIWDSNRLVTLMPLIKSLLQAKENDTELVLLNSSNDVSKEKVIDAVFSSFSKSAAKSLLNENVELYGLFRNSLRKIEYSTYVLRRLQDGVFAALGDTIKLEVSKDLMDIVEGSDIRLAQRTSDSLKRIALDEVTYTSLLQSTRAEFGNGAEEVEPPTSKRIRTEKTSNETSHTGLLARLTSIFDWVGSLSAEDSPEPSVQALVTTFETLAQVTEIHATVAGSNDSSEVDYVEQMCLSQLKEWSESIEDWTNLAQAIRIDTVVNVIRVSKNPQTFQQALLLISALAKLAPDNVLHNVMPIFTFMGANILQRDDSFSFNVVQKTIEGVVPVVVNSLNSQAKDQESLMHASKPFLMTFTDAANHIPKHRRLVLFSFLVEVLDPIKYLSTILMLLVDKVANKVVKSASERQAPIVLPLGILTAFGPQEQLTSLERILTEISSFEKRLSGAQNEKVFLDRSVDDKTKDKATLWKRQSLALLYFVEQAFQINKIKSGVVKSILSDNVIENKLVSIIRQLLLLGSDECSNDEMRNLAKGTLISVLNVIPVASFTRIVKELLSSSNENVQHGALHVLSIRLKGVKDSHRQQVSEAVISAAHLALNLLKAKNAKSGDKDLALSALKTIADTAVNAELSVLSKSVSSVLEFAEGTQNPVSAFSLLESLTPKLQTRLIPHLKQIIEVSKRAIENDRSVEAALNCIRSVVNNLPTFVGVYLKDIFNVVFNNVVIEKQADKIQTLLNALSRRIPSKDLIAALKDEWESVLQTSSQDSVEAFLYLFKRGLHAADRSYIMENHKKLFKMFLEVFTVRTYANEKQMDSVLVEDSAIEAFAEIVVKINESTFRPIFKRFYDWAVVDLSEEVSKKDTFNDRRITFYRVFNSLLDNLKAIIAPYTAICYDHTLALLNEYTTKSSSSAHLWEAAVSTIAKSVKMDRGTFWTEERIVKVSDILVAQIKVQPSMTKSGIRRDVTSNAIVETANSSRTDSTLRRINGGVLLNMRDDSAIVKVVALEITQDLWRAIPDRMIGFIAETVSSFLTECLEDSDERVVDNAKKLLKQIEEETDKINNIHLLDVKDGSTFYQFAGGDICSIDAFTVESPTRNKSRFTFLPTLNALPDVSKSINQFLPFRLPKMEKKDGDYVKTLIDKGFPYIPIESTSVAMNYDNMVITPQLDIYTLTHYGKIAIPRDIHHLGALSSQLSMVLSYALEGVTRLTKLYADNGGPRSESLKWCDKIGEFMRPHCSDTPELGLIQLLLMGTTSKGLREFISESLTDRTLEKWSTTVLTSLNQMQSLIFYNIVPSLERLLVMLEELQSITSAPDRYQGIPINHTTLEQIIRITISLCNRLWDITVIISNKVINFSEFTKFLKYQMAKYAYFNQDEIDEVVNMPKPEFDIMAVLQYLQSGFAMIELDEYLIKNDHPVAFNDENMDVKVDINKVLEKAQRNLKEASRLVEGKETNDRRVSGSGLPIKGRHSRGRQSESPTNTKRQSDLLSTVNWLSEQLQLLLCNAVDKCDVRIELNERPQISLPDTIHIFRDSIVKAENGELYQNIAYSIPLSEEQTDSESKNTYLALFRLTSIVTLLRCKLDNHSDWQVQQLHLPTTRVVDYGYFDDEILVVLVFDRESSDYILANVPFNNLSYDGSRVVAPLDKQRTLSKADEPVSRLALNGLPGRRISALSSNDGYGCLVFDMDGDEMESEEEGDEEEMEE